MHREIRNASSGFICRRVAAGWRDLGQHDQSAAIGDARTLGDPGNARNGVLSRDTCPRAALRRVGWQTMAFTIGRSDFVY
jgi:hypothetical protein